MQLNIYVPKDKEKLVQEIERLAKTQQRSKNELILLALAEYLKSHRAECAQFGVYDLGAQPVDRKELYGKYLEHKALVSE